MSKDDDGFDSVVNGEDDNNGAVPELDDIMEMLAHFWKKFYPGHIFVKGVLVVESVTEEGRAINLQTSSPICDWEILGLTDWAASRVRADINASAWIESMGEEILEEDEEDEDEQ